jgi:surface polysaccharide O-acyltransferase-like enzyme
MSETIQTDRAELRTKNDRMIGLDFGRFVAVTFMIFIHLNSGTPPGNALEELARFAVPYFFMVAGYFQRSPDTDISKNFLKICSRLLKPYVFWLICYLIFFHPSLDKFLNLKFDIGIIIRGGPAYHLWFLPSLMLCSIMLETVQYLKLNATFVFAIAFALYVSGLALGPYYNAWSHMGRFGWDIRNGPFFGFPFMVLGWSIARHNWQLGKITAALTALAGLLCIRLEVVSQNQFHTGYGHDMLVGTVPYAVGMFFLFKDLRPGALTSRMARIGQFSLGIFCVHLVFVVTISSWPLSIVNDTVTELVDWALVALLSVTTCLVMSRVRWANTVIR